MNRAPRVLALIGDESGCSLWRTWQPFAELERRSYVAEWAHKDDSDRVLPLVAAGRYDAVLTPRIVWPAEGLGDIWLNAIHRAGLAWLYEADDDIFSPGITQRQIKLFETEAAKGFDQLEWEREERIRLIQKCDGITVTTRRLQTIVSLYAPEIPCYVVPNAIDANWFRQTLKGCDRIEPLMGKLTIGWAGGTREDADVLPLAESWSVVAQKYPDVQFVVQGHIPQVLVDSVPAGRIWTLPWLPLHEYPRGLLNIDIGCCIVAPTVFNGSKSAIKWYEMTLAGASCVVSPTVYGREVTHAHDGLVAQSTSDWIASLSSLVEDAEMRRDIQRNARRTVMEKHSLENNWWRWPESWKDAIERFQEKQARKLIVAV